ncbi:MAG: glycosyltransferase family 2 protein, partial [Planctomycetota bacterium]
MSRKPKKRLSLCLITKDEERFLPGCLSSIRDFVDEIVVADTGSRDRTVEIAREFGAKIVPFTWCDDFAAARNAAVDAATGDVILSLDADEELAPGYGKELRRFALKEPFLVGLLPLHNATSLDAKTGDILSGRARLGEPTYLPRLFPNHPEMRFVRRVHEQVGGDLIRARKIVGGKLRGVETPLLHWGNVPELRTSLDKERRNRELLELSLREDPTDGDLAGYLASMYFQADDHEGVLKLGREVLPHLFAKIDALASLEFAPSPIQFAGAVAASAIRIGQLETARQALEEASKRIAAPHP